MFLLQKLLLIWLTWLSCSPDALHLTCCGWRRSWLRSLSARRASRGCPSPPSPSSASCPPCQGQLQLGSRSFFPPFSFTCCCWLRWFCWSRCWRWSPGDSFATSSASATSPAPAGNLGVRFVHTEVPALRAGPGPPLHRVPAAVREAPVQHHRAHGLRHRAAEVLQHPGLPLRHPSLRGRRHPGALQCWGPGTLAWLWCLETTCDTVAGASQATSGVEAEQPNVAAPASDGQASTNSAKDLRGGDIGCSGQGLPAEAKGGPFLKTFIVSWYWTWRAQNTYGKYLTFNPQIRLWVQSGERVQRLWHGVQGRRQRHRVRRWDGGERMFFGRRRCFGFALRWWFVLSSPLLPSGCCHPSPKSPTGLVLLLSPRPIFLAPSFLWY